MRYLYPRIRENSHEPQKQKKNLGGITFEIRPKEGYHSLRMTVSPSLPLPPSLSFSLSWWCAIIKFGVKEVLQREFAPLRPGYRSLLYHWATCELWAEISDPKTYNKIQFKSLQVSCILGAKYQVYGKGNGNKSDPTDVSVETSPTGNIFVSWQTNIVSARTP